MRRNRIVMIVVGVLVVAGALWLRSHFSAENVIRRSLLGAISAFEQERILGAVQVLSRGYSDRWGMTYETLAGHMRTAMDTYDGLQVDLEPPAITVDGERASCRFRFILWGSYEGTRGYVIGSLADPVTIDLGWRKEAQGWRITSTDELDIPELRDELREMSSRQ